MNLTLRHSESVLVSINEDLIRLVDGSLHTFCEDICIGSYRADERRVLLEDRIREVGDLQTAAQKTEGRVLQDHGMGSPLAEARRTSACVATVVATLEDLLLADMEGQLDNYYRSNGLRYQSGRDVCHGNL